jgi:hypothetical protein
MTLPKSLSKARMEQHVAEVVDRHEIVVSHCTRNDKSWGSVEAWEIQISTVKSEISYATALHEIGHYADIGITVTFLEGINKVETRL